MKKFILIPSLMMVAIGIFTSCADDMDMFENNPVAQVSAPAADGFDGTYVCVSSDLGGDMKYMLDVDKDNVSLKMVNRNGNIVKVVSGKAAYDAAGVANVSLGGDVDGVTGLKMRKIGAFYYECMAQMNNGAEKEMGFVVKSATRLNSSVSDLIPDDVMQKVAKSAFRSLVGLLPGGDFFNYAFLDMIFPAKSDMKVAESFALLNEGLMAINEKLDDLKGAIADMNYDRALDEHRRRQFDIHDANQRVLFKIASLQEQAEAADAGKDSIHHEIVECLKKWQSLTINGSPALTAVNSFIRETAEGYGTLGRPWFHLIDTYAEHTFPWEHQAYDLRELYRTRDMITCLEGALLYKMYVNNVEYDPQFNETGLLRVKEDYVDNRVVRDTVNAVCQIAGLNHIKINRNSLNVVPMRKQTGTYKDHSLDFENTFDFDRNESLLIHSNGTHESEYWKKLDFLVVPRAYKLKGDDFTAAANRMLTKSEAEKMYKYYGGRLTFREILENEAGIPDTEYDAQKDGERDNVLLLYGVHVTTYHLTDTKKYDGDVDRWNIVFDSACHIDKKDGVFNNLWIADYHMDSKFQKTWFWDYETYTLVEKFDHWTKYNTGSRILNLSVQSREKNWKPAEY